jgi:hypothetical protein
LLSRSIETLSGVPLFVIEALSLPRRASTTVGFALTLRFK